MGCTCSHNKAGNDSVVSYHHQPEASPPNCPPSDYGASGDFTSLSHLIEEHHSQQQQQQQQQEQPTIPFQERRKGSVASSTSSTAEVWEQGAPVLPADESIYDGNPTDNTSCGSSFFLTHSHRSVAAPPALASSPTFAEIEPIKLLSLTNTTTSSGGGDPPPPMPTGPLIEVFKQRGSVSAGEGILQNSAFLSTSRKMSVMSTHELIRGYDDDGNKLINEYVFLGNLGRGAFGKVKLAINTLNDEAVAIKILNRAFLEKQSRLSNRKPGTQKEGGREEEDETANENVQSLLEFSMSANKSPIQLVQQEIEIMKMCRHPCLVKLINVIKDPNAPKLYLVMEFMEGGTLSKTPSLSARGPLPVTPIQIDINRIRCIFLDVLYGLQFLHGKGVIHMDIKPENILVGKDGSCKLADFGVCTVLSDNFEADGGEREDVVHAKQGTPLYFAPEMLREGSFRGKATDVWALGVTMYVVVYGRLPFDGSTMSEYNENVATQDPVYYNTTSAITTEPEQHRLLTDVMRRMLCKDGSQRISVRDLLGHPFFNNMREDKVPLEWWVRCWKNSKSKTS